MATQQREQTQITRIANLPKLEFSEQIKEITNVTIPSKPIAIDLGSPSRRTSWYLQNLSIQLPSLTWRIERTGDKVAKQSQKVRLVFTLSVGGNPFVVEILPKTFTFTGEEELLTEQIEEKIVILETYTNLYVPGGQQLSLITSFNLVEPFLNAKPLIGSATTSQTAQIVATMTQVFGPLPHT